MTQNEKLLWRAVNSSVYASITDVNFDISLSCGWPFGLLVYLEWDYSLRRKASGYRYGCALYSEENYDH